MNFIPLARPDIHESDIEAMASVLRTGNLVQGINVLALEESFAHRQHSRYAIAASSGTATLHLALLAFGIGPGDEVIVPALSYIATANVVELVGAKAVFVDIDILTYNIDVGKCEAAITANTKAIIPVHEFGLACDIDEICVIASRHKILVIEDAACALGACQHGKPVGSFGDIGSFSLHPRKSITSGEGGVLVTGQESLNKKIRQLRNHGIEMHEGTMEFEESGFNYRLTDFQAALALSQFKRLDSILNHKAKIAGIYLNEIRNPRISLPSVPVGRNHTWQTFHVLLSEELDQRNTILHLTQKGIGTNYGAQCIPAQRYYQRKYGYNAKALFPNAYRAFASGLAIPLYEKLGEDQILYIAKTMNEL